MKLAIHNGIGWNLIWREYCQKNDIPFIAVNCYSNDIISILKENEITHLMWLFHHNSPKDILMARNILFSSEKIGIKTFPNFNTCWHFDDKVSQKYLLEAIDAPMVPSHVFYEKEEALVWLKNEAEFPIVAKLRRGAGSYNVKLLNNYYQANKYVSKMFSSGINPRPGYLADAKNKLKVAGDFKGIVSRLKKAPKYFKMVMKGRMFPKEKGYVYFQDFIKNNNNDIRITIIGNYIWAYKRKVRKGDFRASGSGMIDYDISDLPISLIKKLHELSKVIGAQSIVFDLVIDGESNYLIVEISYGFVGELVYNCLGYWDENYNFNNKHLQPEHLILDNFIK